MKNHEVYLLRQVLALPEQAIGLALVEVLTWLPRKLSVTLHALHRAVCADHYSAGLLLGFEITHHADGLQVLADSLFFIRRY